MGRVCARRQRSSISSDGRGISGNGHGSIDDGDTVDEPVAGRSWGRQIANRSGVDHGQCVDISERNRRVCRRSGDIGCSLHIGDVEKSTRSDVTSSKLDREVGDGVKAGDEVRDDVRVGELSTNRLDLKL